MGKDVKTCPTCNGNTNCRTCSGTGYKQDPHSVVGFGKVKCTKCGGSGNCTRCKGRGVVPSP